MLLKYSMSPGHIELLSLFKVEKKGKGKKDKADAKALAKAEKELAEA